MTTNQDLDRPADTRMMAVVHQALARDLARIAEAVGHHPPPDVRQRAALARHARWTTAFLRAHHESEDRGLYPVVRQRRPDAAELLDGIDADHRTVAALVQDVERAADAYGQVDEAQARAALAAAVDALAAALLPHLQREEELVMPVVSEAVTMREWQAIEEEHNLRGKGMRQLAEEGHWLIDEASPEDRALVLGLVPPGPRFVLLHGFARSYRRRRDQWWHPSARAHRVQKHGRTEVVVPADPEAVWAVVRDVTRTGEWSHECVSCELMGGATDVVPGVRFRGRNRQGRIRWGRVCEVVSADGHELVWRTVPTVLYPDSTEWAIRVMAADGGTRIEQRFDVVRAPKLLDVIYARLVPAHCDRSAALAEDLRRLGTVASVGAVRQPTGA